MVQKTISFRSMRRLLDIARSHAKFTRFRAILEASDSCMMPRIRTRENDFRTVDWGCSFPSWFERRLLLPRSGLSSPRSRRPTRWFISAAHVFQVRCSLIVPGWRCRGASQFAFRTTVKALRKVLRATPAVLSWVLFLCENSSSLALRQRCFTSERK